MSGPNRRVIRRNGLLALGVYIGSWILGIVLALKFIPADVIQHVDIHPQQQSAWLYISHNLELELLFLVGALTLGLAPLLLLFWNGCLEGIIAAAVAEHYGVRLVLVSLLPHGIPEALAWILIGTCSLLLSRHLRRLFFAGKKQQSASPPAEKAAMEHLRWIPGLERLPWQISNIYSMLIIISALLIIVAGILEATVSPWLMRVTG